MHWRAGDLRGCPARRRTGGLATLRFPDAVLYLAPEPDEPFRQPTMAIWHRYPETPPDSGKWPDIVPYLSVAWVKDEQLLDRIADDFAQDVFALL